MYERSPEHYTIIQKQVVNVENPHKETPEETDVENDDLDNDS
jgi:hypothetical protein